MYLPKKLFLKKSFLNLDIETVFMRIRKKNIRSLKAAEKLPYAMKANETRETLYEQVNQGEEIFDLFEIPKDLYTLHILRQDDEDDQHLMEA